MHHSIYLYLVNHMFLWKIGDKEKTSSGNGEARETYNKRMQIAAIIISLLNIFFITLFSRTPTLTRTVHLDLFWSYVSAGHWKQILLNIALFVPFGYFLTSSFTSSHSPWLRLILTAFATSLVIEFVQFLTYRGMLDVDDLLSNVLGAVLGLLMFRFVRMSWKGRGAAVMLIVSLIGCLMVAVSATNNNISTRITEQFQFSISTMKVDDKVIINGECFLYDRATPDYTIFIGGKEASDVVNGEKFKLEIEVSGKVEVQVKFQGFPVMPTGIWINEDRIEYVDGELPVISGQPENAVLKAWNEEYDTLVYQDGNRLIWLIGSEINRNTEIIYHLHTNEPEKLPEERVQYKFDNRGFRVGTDKEIESIGHYRVFEDIIPTDYNVTAIVVGFNTEGTITWMESFRPT